jgi:hypothetical protein
MNAIDALRAHVARETGRPATGEQSEGASAPSFRPSAQGSLKAEDLYPTEYLLRIGDQQCDCGEVYRHHELLLVYTHPSWTGSTKFRKLVPVDRRTMPDLKVGTSFLQTKHIPLCISCVADVRQPAPRAQCSDREWAEAIAAESRARRAAVASPRKAEPAAPKVDIRKLSF